ncbi:MAG TPA: helix-turn-helix transcriptional regulator [Flavihumibacter sp.]|nr:helix-turn-helix transcriptional regulator [Flavihumibacter sp.]HPZ87463.1 helix-turn-helix transcriptional regulator [Flavihumibacter sp.]HQD08786.1 helix-turn-helix transcriptional regulator [Flavihumibacter sp.]
MHLTPYNTIYAKIADGRTNNEIAQQLFISVTTVDTHRKYLLAKFAAKNIASLVKTAVQLHIIGD